MRKQNLINLDESANHFYPSLNPNTKIHHILSHTTGFKRLGWNNKIENNVAREQLLKELAMSEQQNVGKAFDYHNVAYSLLEGIIETSQKQPFKDVVTQRLFIPLGMTRSTIGYPDFLKQENKAWPHQEDKNGILYPSRTYSRFYHAVVPSAAGMNASIKDMAEFLKLQLIGAPGLLDAEDLEEFHSPVVEAKDALSWSKPAPKDTVKSFYGFGWRIFENGNKRIVLHGGWVKGFKSFLGFLPDQKIGIIILHNGENAFAHRTGKAFLGEWIS